MDIIKAQLKLQSKYIDIQFILVLIVFAFISITVLQKVSINIANDRIDQLNNALYALHERVEKLEEK